MIKLYPYQQKAINFIKQKKKCALYLGMGLGKTVITLTTLQQLFDEFIIAKVLIIAPKQVANNVWHTELHKWEHLNHLTYSLIIGDSKTRTIAMNKNIDIYITNKENVHWLYNQNHTQWDVVVIDESSSFKNNASKRFKYLCKFKYDYMIQLTGTPSPNGLLDLWAQLYLLDKGKRLGRTMSNYKNTHFISDYMGYNYTPKDVNKILNSIADITLSMQSEDYIDLPPQIFVTTQITNPAQEKYNELEKEFIANINGKEITAFNAATLSGKLLQFCNGAIYDEHKNIIHVHNAKLDALECIIEDNPNENILVAYNFKSDLKRLLLRFPNAIQYDGSSTITKLWNNRQIKLLLAHPISSGKGLNLQYGGNTIVWFGLTWNLEDYLQFNARLYRQGQLKPVIINHLVIKNSIEEKVLTVLSQKDALQSKLFKTLMVKEDGRTTTFPQYEKEFN
jgi:SNF2 family DNA or RNA helicase